MFAALSSERTRAEQTRAFIFTLTATQLRRR
jgi:hypothetical protein